jgi:hypothetical protein
METLLTTNEWDRLVTYRRQWSLRYSVRSQLCNWAIFNLAQSFEKQCSWSAASCAIPTLTTKFEKIWSDFLGRWLTLKELQTGMGQCAYDEMAAAAGVRALDLSNLCMSDARFLVGNSMHVVVVGTVASCALACSRPRTVLAQSSGVKRKRME